MRRAQKSSSEASCQPPDGGGIQGAGAYRSGSPGSLRPPTRSAGQGVAAVLRNRERPEVVSHKDTVLLQAGDATALNSKELLPANKYRVTRS